MTAMEFVKDELYMMKNESWRNYMVNSFKNVIKCNAVLAIILALAMVIGMTCTATGEEQYRYTTNGVRIYDTDDGGVRTDLCSYSRNAIDDVWASISMSKQFLKFWKRNFQITDRYWMTPNGCLATWEFIEEYTYDRAFNIYGNRFYYEGVEVILPDGLDVNNDMWMFGSYDDEPGKIYLDILTVTGTSVDINEYDSYGTLVKSGSDPYANMDWWIVE